MLSSAYLRLKLLKSRICVLAVLLLLLAFILTNGSFESSHCSCDKSEEPGALSSNKVQTKCKEQNAESAWEHTKSQTRVQNVVRKRRQIIQLHKSAVRVYQPEKSNTAAQSASVVNVFSSQNSNTATMPRIYADVDKPRVLYPNSPIQNNKLSVGQWSAIIMQDGLQSTGRTGANPDCSIWGSLFPQYSDSEISYFHPTNKPTENCYCPYPLRTKNTLCYHMVTCFPRTTTISISSTSITTTTTMSTTSSTTDSTTTDSTTTDSTTTDSTTTDSTTTDSTTTDSTTTDSTTTDSTTTDTTTTTTPTTTTTRTSSKTTRKTDRTTSATTKRTRTTESKTTRRTMPTTTTRRNNRSSPGTRMTKTPSSNNRK
ncbi:uncharacterized protein LOC126566642 [Anopheles maculipalpis]|uniref:uncharacterized protein LOC126566642 n=1 Tax=Anopheles maculipalpis TaxID=1496333 RepID=UPI0021595093|nr:uncharacterized protein LOC126566642 [Anopheles maculipalpis]